MLRRSSDMVNRSPAACRRSQLSSAGWLLGCAAGARSLGGFASRGGSGWRLGDDVRQAPVGHRLSTMSLTDQAIGRRPTPRGARTAEGRRR
jgi:hypothetical protein